MVYWDYYHEDEKLYDTYIQNHQKLNKKLIFAGGIWTWNGIAPNYGKIFATTIAALTSCKRNGVKEVFATVWGDDGNETPLMTILPGLQLFVELTYRDEYDKKRMEMELEETKLPFSGPEYLGEGTLGRGFYSELITTGKISGC